MDYLSLLWIWMLRYVCMSMRDLPFRSLFGLRF